MLITHAVMLMLYHFDAHPSADTTGAMLHVTRKHWPNSKWRRAQSSSTHPKPQMTNASIDFIFLCPRLCQPWLIGPLEIRRQQETR